MTKRKLGFPEQEYYVRGHKVRRCGGRARTRGSTYYKVWDTFGKVIDTALTMKRVRQIIREHGGALLNGST